jgi:hypothetical protein
MAKKVEKYEIVAQPLIDDTRMAAARIWVDVGLIPGLKYYVNPFAEPTPQKGTMIEIIVYTNEESRFKEFLRALRKVKEIRTGL